jgi:hypothetical protein
MYLVELGPDFAKQHLARAGRFLDRRLPRPRLPTLHEAAPDVIRNREGAQAAGFQAKKLGTLLAGAELSFVRQGIRHVNGIS